MIKKILLRTYQKTSGTSRLFTTVPIPEGTIAIQLVGASINNNSIISEYINQKKLGTFKKEITTNISHPYDDIWADYIPTDGDGWDRIISLGFLGKGGEVYSFNQAFLYDIEYNSSASEGIQFFAIVETTAIRLPYVIRPITITIPISSSVLSFELKGYYKRILTLKGGTNPTAQFTIFRNNDIVYETNSLNSLTLSSNFTTQANNTEDKFICKLTGISGNPTHLEITQFVPVFLNKIGPIITPKEILKLSSEL